MPALRTTPINTSTRTFRCAPANTSDPTHLADPANLGNLGNLTPGPLRQATPHRLMTWPRNFTGSDSNCNIQGQNWLSTREQRFAYRRSWPENARRTTAKAICWPSSTQSPNQPSPLQTTLTYNNKAAICSDTYILYFDWFRSCFIYLDYGCVPDLF